MAVAIVVLRVVSNNLFDTNSEEKTKPLCLSEQGEESHL